METLNLTYDEIVDYLMNVASGLTYSGATSGDTGLTMEYVDFGYNYELGLDNNLKGENWNYPAFFLTPSSVLIGENSLLNCSFTITLVHQPHSSLSDRTYIYSNFTQWVVAYLQELDNHLKIVYELSLEPFDVNYDAELVGWQFDINVETNLDCLEKYTII